MDQELMVNRNSSLFLKVWKGVVAAGSRRGVAGGRGAGVTVHRTPGQLQITRAPRPSQTVNVPAPPTPAPPAPPVSGAHTPLHYTSMFLPSSTAAAAAAAVVATPNSHKALKLN
ncbi:hypothetical protein JYU34_007868 [Plutella xylostella]|uniref:Uncharacterized protein n=1 Tax=Plutella xylostella TaxID=51655 RepID=A0ABQ7QRI3_PLUXY|nr:hypothetical protein JYU34_007868 [Plutella xylostella]